MSSIVYEKSDIESLKSDQDILDKLKAAWNINTADKIMAWGELRKNEKLGTWFLFNAKKIAPKNYIDSLFEYPIKNLGRDELIRDKRGMYVGSQDETLKQLNNNQIVVCELVLSEKHFRKEHDNPMQLCVNTGSIIPLEKIPLEVLSDNTDHAYLEKYFFEYYRSLNEEKLKLDEINSKEKMSIEASTFRDSIRKEKESLEKNIVKLSSDSVSLDKEIEYSKQSLLAQKEKEKNLKDSIFKLSEGESILISEIEMLNKSKSQVEKDMSKKLERLLAFVKKKADLLKSLEFIDEDDFNDITGKNYDAKIDKPSISFENDLDGDFSRAISHIQSYLGNKNIYYPRWVLEDFLALIQTNDLIILAGESGSGKTNLVKSFADAVGGISKIIPVKPNWTGREDLLGYYNPLEQKYLATEFLDTILEAAKFPDIPYFICLDEMNLARVEYYFADFLSLLEDRKEAPTVHLYSDDESSHVLSEFTHVLQAIADASEKFLKGKSIDFYKILKDKEINNELKRIFGFSDKDSLIKYHSDLKKMLGGILNTPSSFKFPENVRIIGAINIDETTHFLSPKILDRAHIMKFDSPLLYDWSQLLGEIEDNKNKELIIKFDIESLGIKEEYPKFDHEDEFCRLIMDYTKNFFSPMGVEVGLRTIRQGLNYRDIFMRLNSNEELILNNFFIHKILPKFNFDGNKSVGNGKNKNFLLLELQEQLKEQFGNGIEDDQGVDVLQKVEELIKKAEANDLIVNYWA